MPVSDNLLKLKESLPQEVELVLVSKTHPPELIMDAYRTGQRIFGENRPQEMKAKRVLLPDDIRWHMIGHLQTNKIKYIVPFVEMIHSTDSPHLLEQIDRQAAKIGRVIDVLLEIHIAAEQNKEGWQWEELVQWLERGSFRGLANLRFRGVMGVATYTQDQSLVREEFDRLAAWHGELKRRFFSPAFDTISMGMTDDYKIAVGSGSNMVRIGSLVFGDR